MIQTGKTRGVMYVLIASFGFGTMPAMAQRAIAAGASVQTLLAFRVTIAASLIWLYVVSRRPVIQYRLNKNQVIYLLFLGLLSIGIGTFMFESYKFIPGAITSLLTFSYVILVLLIEIMIGREKPNLSKFGSVLLATAGMALVVWAPEGQALFHPLGILFAFLAGLSNALFVIGIGGKAIKGVSSEVVVAYTMLPVAVFNISRALLAQQPLIPLEPNQFSYGLYIALFSTFMAGLFFVKGIKTIGGSNAGLINMTEPFIAYLAGILLMSDVLSLRAVMGGVMIITAIIWLNLIGRKNTVLITRF